MLDDRKLAVLRAIIEDYVSTTEPVGSKTLVDRHNLDVSPATIRNDMAVLEEQGYIAQPHTSAGRIPTDKGYRLFVDRMSAVKPLSRVSRFLLARRSLLGRYCRYAAFARGMASERISTSSETPGRPPKKASTISSKLKSQNGRRRFRGVRT